MIYLLLLFSPFIGSALIAVLRGKRAHDIRVGKKYPNLDEEKNLNGMTVLLSIVDGLIIGAVVFFICANEPHWYLSVCAVLAGILLELLLIGLMAGWFNWRRFLAWCGCVLVTAGGIWGGNAYVRHLRDITMPDAFDFRTYLPFREDSPVATLDGESTLRFTRSEKLPKMDGATALYPVYAAFAQAAYPESLRELSDWDVKKLVDCSTTGSAYKHIVNGDCDIIFVGGPSEEQEAYAAEKGVELVYTPIGREAFVFFVHPDNPIDSLSIEQIRDIYAGRITHWDRLGAKGLGKILAYQRSEGSGSQTAILRYVMGDTPLMPAEKEMVAGEMGGIVQNVSSYKNHRNAIGYSFRFYCTGLMRGFDVKLLAIDGVAPTVENIENGTYPLASCFYAVTRADADKNTLALLEWITGPQGQELVEKAGYTPLAADGD